MWSRIAPPHKLKIFNEFDAGAIFELTLNYNNGDEGGYRSFEEVDCNTLCN